MKTYLEINSLANSKIEIVVFIHNGTDYQEVRKHVMLRADFTPFTYNLLDNKFKVYLLNLGQYEISQDDNAPDVILKVLKVDGVDVTDNTDLYNKIKNL